MFFFSFTMSNLHSICNYTYYVIHDKLTFFKNFLKYICIRSAIFSLKEIQHIVQINLFPDVDLILGFRHIIKQKFKDQCTAKSSSFNFKVSKSHWQIGIFYILDPYKFWIFHRFGKLISFRPIRCGTSVIRTVLS